MVQDNGLTQDQRLKQTEARFAVADLIHEYARLIRRDLSDEVAPLFTEDGVFEVRDGHPDKPEFSVRSRIEGREALEAYMANGKGKPHPIPVIHNLSVDVEGDTAHSNCVMEGQVYGTDLKVLGEYHDTFRCDKGRWLFASRIFTVFSAASSV